MDFLDGVFLSILELLFLGLLAVLGTVFLRAP